MITPSPSSSCEKSYMIDSSGTRQPAMTTSISTRRALLDLGLQRFSSIRRSHRNQIARKLFEFEANHPPTGGDEFGPKRDTKAARFQVECRKFAAPDECDAPTPRIKRLASCVPFAIQIEEPFMKLRVVVPAAIDLRPIRRGGHP